MTSLRSAIDLAKILQLYVALPFLMVLLPFVIKKYICSWLNLKKLQGKVVLITGASSGLGEALAKELYKKGCKLILAARRMDQLERVKADIQALNCDCMTYTPEVIKMDVSELGSIPKVVEDVLKIHGKVDILINNAGISFRGEVVDTSMDVHQKIMLVNYFGQICLTKALLPSMIAQKSGQIVMVNSIQGKVGLPHRSAYSAAKHALLAYSDCLRAEIARKGILVTAVYPGYINTSLSVNALTSSGSQYAKMDEATAKGYTTTEAALMIISSISNEDKESIQAPFLHKIAIPTRHLFPNIFFKIMYRRANKDN